MQTHVEVRVDALERRVLALEARLLPEVPAAPARAPAPPRVSATGIRLAPRPPPPTTAPRPGEFEAWLGGVLLARVGIGAVVLAAGYFAQLAYKHVDDLFKVLSLYALAGALAAVGWLLHTRVAPRFVGLLWGGATAVAYVAGVAATLRYELVDIWAGLALVTGAAALGTWFSHRLKVEAIGLISLGAAFVAPVVLQVVYRDPNAVIVLAAGLGLWGALAEQLFGWRSVRIVGLLGTLALATFASFHRPWLDAGPFARVLAACTLVMLPDLVAGLRGRDARLGVRVVIGLTVGLLALLALRVPRGSGLDWLGRWPGCCGLLWSGMALTLGLARPGGAAPRLTALLGVLGGLSLVVGAASVRPTTWWNWEPALAAAVVAGLLVSLRRVTRVSDLALGAAGVLALVLVGEAGRRVGTPRVPHLDLLLASARVLLALVPAALLAWHGRTPRGRTLGLLLGSATLLAAFLEPALRREPGWLIAPALVGAGLLLLAHEGARRRQDDASRAMACGLLGLANLAWIALLLVPQGRAPSAPPFLDHFTLAAVGLALAALRLRHLEQHDAEPLPLRPGGLALAAVALVLAAGGREVFLLTRGLDGAAPRIAMSLYLVLAGAVALAAGFRARLALLRWVALGLFATAVGKVGLVDLAQAELPLRVLVTGVLGLVLLAAAYGYAQRGGAKPALARGLEDDAPDEDAPQDRGPHQSASP